ncbi:MAG: sialate O-acetylesterase [Verrucomicrobiota bacterium]|jgi:sialate O-acetylesterase
MKSRLLPLRIAGIVFASILVARADVRLHGLFTDDMVLQRDASVPVWGWADDGEKVTVQFRNQSVTTTAAHGKWTVHLKHLSAGGPDELKVTGKNTVILHNVVVGEVWIASGQSNMEMAMRSVFDATNEIARTSNPLIRFYTVSLLKADHPVQNVSNTWQVSGPQVAPKFSAVAYYFARDLQKALGVPVGIVHTSWGGSPCEVWIREGVLAANAGYKRDILDAYPEALRRVEGTIAAWEREKADALAAGTNFTKRRPGPWKPSELYNGMIAPLIPFAIRGAIWYQGESNAGRAHQYRTLMADMISNWRKDWGQGDFTFLQVQLAPFKDYKPEPAGSEWAELREAQNYVARSLPKAGVAVITDVGEEKDIHPKRKEPVGARLALAARHIAYGENIVYSGPTYRSMTVKRDQAILSFNHVGAGLEARTIPARPNSAGSALVYNARAGNLEAPLAGFTICGDDQKFYRADARIQGEKVVVSNPQVSKPVAVRYGWADFPVVNLWNRDGLPASPFRTDNFPMITAPKTAPVKK